MDNRSEKLYYTIGEVADMIGEAPSLLRFWEKEFPQLKPIKNDKGIRKYSRKEVTEIKFVHHLLKDKGMTIDGARKYLQDQKRIHDKAEMIDKLTNIKSFLMKLRNAIN
ncbi:MAG: MerR family transcriptional regulator [Bacteroidota bacterium]|jgi:DNA-binding transcriptional MerR regulator